MSPALAVIEEIQAQQRPWDILFVGREKTSHQSKEHSEEYAQMKKRGIPFIPIRAGKLSRYVGWDAVRDFFSIPIGCIDAWRICMQHRPDCIVSFGGFIGLPMVLAGWLLGIPTIIHEQTHQLGLANAIASEFADRILLTFADETRGMDERVTVVGLPIRKSFLCPPSRCSFPLSHTEPLLYITGGTTGSVSVNALLFPIIGDLIATHVVVHQTGAIAYPDAVKLKQSLPEKVRNRYIPKAYIESADVSWIMHHMVALVGRSGANTVMETAVVGKPAVFIPLPMSGNKEQLKNALWYAALTKEVRILNQEQSKSNDVKNAITDLLYQPQINEKVPRKLFTTGAASVVESIAALVR